MGIELNKNQNKCLPISKLTQLRESETSKLPDIDKTKYLVPNDLSAYHFNYIIRKRIKLPETGSLYFFVNGRYLLKGDTLMSEVYKQRKDADGFLYITYTDETTLGAQE